MGNWGVEQLLYLLDEAFEGNEEHSLLGNLRTVTPDDWLWVPLGDARSISQIVRHVGACKYMYENHAFGDGNLTWSDPLLEGPKEQDKAVPAVEGLIDWLREGQRRLRQSIAALDDDELGRPRKTHWGELAESRWIISVMIQHDLYHAGEINHIRALRQRNDRWAWDQG
jgi:uncharacterized damage-inducible protein DinB